MIIPDHVTDALQFSRAYICPPGLMLLRRHLQHQETPRWHLQTWNLLTEDDQSRRRLDAQQGLDDTARDAVPVLRISESLTCQITLRSASRLWVMGEWNRVSSELRKIVIIWTKTRFCWCLKFYVNWPISAQRAQGFFPPIRASYSERYHQFISISLKIKKIWIQVLPFSD